MRNEILTFKMTELLEYIFPSELGQIIALMQSAVEKKSI